METELGRDKNYVDGLQQLFIKYKLTGWEEPFAKLTAGAGGLRYVDQGDGDAEGAERLQAGSRRSTR